MYYKTELYGDAIASFQKVIELKPNHSDAYIRLGNTYNRLGKKNRSIRCIQKVAFLGNQFAQDWL